VRKLYGLLVVDEEVGGLEDSGRPTVLGPER
jgi:hypothetical protein